MLGGCIVKKVRTLGTKRWVCAILVCGRLLPPPRLGLAARRRAASGGAGAGGGCRGPELREYSRAAGANP